MYEVERNDSHFHICGQPSIIPIFSLLAAGPMCASGNPSENANRAAYATRV
jgi:hypothetical protein